MMRTCSPSAISAWAVVSLLAIAGTSQGQIFATCGFNDVTGVNGDGLANNLPYNVQNVSLGGQGGSDPGFSSWGVNFAQVVNSGQFEGDGAAYLPPGGSLARRSFAMAPGLPPPFLVSVKLKIESGFPAGAIVDGELHTSSFGTLFYGWHARSDGHFWLDQPSGIPVDSGLTFTPGIYQTIDVLVNFSLGRWDFSVDGVHYNQPLQLIGSYSQFSPGFISAGRGPPLLWAALFLTT